MSQPKPRPPFLARLLLRLVPPSHRANVAGDLLEEYAEHVSPRRGRLVASLWLLSQTVRTALAFLRYRPSGSHAAGRGGRWSGPRLSHAYRAWRRRPGFALLASTTLGLGIGAATSVFGVVDWILFRPISGVDDPNRLVMIEFRDPEGRAAGMSLPNLRDLSAATSELTHLAAHSALPVQAVSSALSPVSLVAQVVTGEYFALLGARASAGRLIGGPEADGIASQPLVVVSHDLWRRAFQESPSVVGSVVRLNGQSFVVAGVAPEGFHGVDRTLDVDLWVGGTHYAALRHAPPGVDWSMTARDARIFHGIVGRMGEGADPATVEGQLRAGMRALVAAYPEVNETYDTHAATVFEGIGLRPIDRDGVASIARAFIVIVLITLVIACANVANLLVVQGIKRRAELAVRRALGEPTSRLYLQHALEALLLAVPATVFGLFVAAGLNASLWETGFLPTGPVPDIAIDGRVAAFAVALSVVTALSFGLLPAVFTARNSVASHLTGARGAPRRVTWVQGALTVSQLALSLALLAGAGVLARTILNLHRVDLGFSPERVTVYRLDPGPQGYSEERNVAFHRDVLSAVRALPGTSASTAAYEPFGEVVNFVQVAAPDRNDTLLVRANWVADDYFATLDIPVLEGAGFGDGVAGTVILSRHTARELFGESSAVGRSVTVSSYSGTEQRRVAGVVGDVVTWNPRRPTPGLAYLPLTESPVARAALLVHTPMPRTELDHTIRTAAGGVDPNVPVSAGDAMRARVERSMAEERSLARIVGLLAFVACGLAGVGLYSVIAYATQERTREFGIKIALGATDERIVRSVFARSLVFGVGGTAVGVLVSVGFSRVIGNQVFGVAPLDPLSLGVAAGVLCGISVVAAVVPAVAAARVDPIRCLNV